MGPASPAQDHPSIANCNHHQRNNIINNTQGRETRQKDVKSRTSQHQKSIIKPPGGVIMFSNFILINHRRMNEMKGRGKHSEDRGLGWGRGRGEGRGLGGTDFPTPAGVVSISGRVKNLQQSWGKAAPPGDDKHNQRLTLKHKHTEKTGRTRF
jgi:hypothetical protein